MASELQVIYILDKLLLDQEFAKDLEKSLENIMKDGKIDQNDIPEIVFIISNMLNKMPTKLNLSVENLTEVIKKLVHLVCKKYKLIPDDTQQESFDRLLQSSIKLLLLNQTIVKEKLKKCWSFMPCVKK